MLKAVSYDRAEAGLWQAAQPQHAQWLIRGMCWRAPGAVPHEGRQFITGVARGLCHRVLAGTWMRCMAPELVSWFHLLVGRYLPFPENRSSFFTLGLMCCRYSCSQGAGHSMPNQGPAYLAAPSVTPPAWSGPCQGMLIAGIPPGRQTASPPPKDRFNARCGAMSTPLSCTLDSSSSNMQAAQHATYHA